MYPGSGHPSAPAGVAAANRSHLHLSLEHRLWLMRTAWLEDAWEVILPQEGGLNQLSIEARSKALRPLASEQDGFGPELKLQSSWWDQAVAKVPVKPHLCPDSPPALSLLLSPASGLLGLLCQWITCTGIPTSGFTSRELALRCPQEKWQSPFLSHVHLLFLHCTFHKYQFYICFWINSLYHFPISPDLCESENHSCFTHLSFTPTNCTMSSPVAELISCWTDEWICDFGVCL